MLTVRIIYARMPSRIIIETWNKVMQHCAKFLMIIKVMQCYILSKHGE